MVKEKSGSAISVIISVYNTASYLERCMKSILCQTYEELEIICVDDESVDGSMQLCDEYALKDNRIKVIHKDNKGVVSSRKRD